MGLIQAVINNIGNSLENSEITTSSLLAVFLVVVVLSFYEFFVYQVVLKRSLYNKAFNIAIAVLPLFIATIILCLQSNLVITLGTIGALAIIRFRTAVKDPVDLIFILWSIHIGVTCGCQLYEIAIMTSLAATAILILLNRMNLRVKSHILVLHCKSAQDENTIVQILTSHVKNYRIKSRNHTNKGMDYVFEIVMKNAENLAMALEKEECIERFSLMEYDSDDVL